MISAHLSSGNHVRKSERAIMHPNELRVAVSHSCFRLLIISSLTTLTIGSDIYDKCHFQQINKWSIIYLQTRPGEKHGSRMS